MIISYLKSMNDLYVQIYSTLSELTSLQFDCYIPNFQVHYEFNFYTVQPDDSEKELFPKVQSAHGKLIVILLHYFDGVGDIPRDYQNASCVLGYMKFQSRVG